MFTGLSGHQVSPLEDVTSQCDVTAHDLPFVPRRSNVLTLDLGDMSPPPPHRNKRCMLGHTPPFESTNQRPGFMINRFALICGVMLCILLDSDSDSFIWSYCRPRRPLLRPNLVAVAEATWKKIKYTVYMYVQIIVIIKSIS